MGRLEIPISSKILWHTGDVALWTDITLMLKDASGGWKNETFLVDTGSEMTTMAAYAAKNFDLPIPQNPTQGVSHYPTGLVIRSGLLRFRVVGMDATEYATACLFLGDPDTPPDPNQPAASPRKLLQPLGLLDQLRFQFDKDPMSIGAPHGVMTVEKKNP